MTPMFEAAVTEFPFVAELPKRQKSKLATVWQSFREFSALCDRKGMLVPVVVAAKLLDVSDQRIHQLMQAGKLDRIDWEGHPFVTEDSVIALARTERKAGRPFKIPNGVAESARRALSPARK